MNNQIPNITPLLIRRSQLKHVVGLSASTVRRLEATGNFPKRRKIGGVVGWIGSEIEAWLKCQEVVSAHS